MIGDDTDDNTRAADARPPANDGEARRGLRLRATTPGQIIILGMPGSGASVLTCALQAMGVAVSVECAAVGTDGEDQRRFSEPHDMRSICDNLLRSAGAEWWKIAKFDVDQIPQSVLRAHRDQLEKLIGQANDCAGVDEETRERSAWVLNEPRLCFLHPVLKQAFLRPIVVRIVRHPQEVAATLRRRHGLPIDVGLALWEAYNVATINQTLNPTIQVAFRDLIRSPIETLCGLEARLADAGVSGLEPEQGAIAVRRERNREPTSQVPDFDSLSGSQDKLWRMLSEPVARENYISLAEESRRVLLAFEARSAMDFRSQVAFNSDQYDPTVERDDAKEKRAREVDTDDVSETLMRTEQTLAETRRRNIELHQTCDTLERDLIAQRVGVAQLKSSMRWKIGGVLMLFTAPIKILRRMVRERGVHKAKQTIQASGLFDESYYLSDNADILDAEIDPLTHYLTVGWREGRNPNAIFDTTSYLSKYPNLQTAGVNPLLHFIESGEVTRHSHAPEVTGLSPSKTSAAKPSYSGPPMASAWIRGDVPRIVGAPTVLLCAHVVNDQLFGGERSFIDVLDALEGLAINVVVALPTDKFKFYVDLVKARSTGVAIIAYQQWRDNRAADPNVTAEFNDLISRRNIDLVYANTIVLLEPLVAARACGLKTAIHVRELIDRDVALCDQIGLTSTEIIDRVKSTTDFFIANSRETAQLLPGDGRTFCAPNVVDIDALDIPNVIDGTVRFVLASSNIPKKGVADAIKVARICATRNIKAKFIIVGPQNIYVDAWKLDNLPENVTFVGYRDTPKMAMAEGNVVLSLSHFAESFGRTVAEGQAARRPAIAYDHGAVRELIESGETGFLAPYRDIEAVADIVEKICRSPELLQPMGEAGRARAIAQNSPFILHENMRSAMEKILDTKIQLRVDLTSRQLSAPDVTVIVPIYNAFEETRTCLQSLKRTINSGRVRILLLNDASTDPRIAPMLAAFSTQEHVDLITHDRNLGYTGNINAGINAAGDGDVILLNSDTIVTPGFVEGLEKAAYAADRVGTVTAMGDNAGAFSFPVVNSENRKPHNVSYDEHAARILAHTAHCEPVEVPTGSGFCLYIRRALLNDIGLFDEVTFPRGYGEENDFCMRALNAGWKNVITPYAYI